MYEVNIILGIDFPYYPKLERIYMVTVDCYRNYTTLKVQAGFKYTTILLEPATCLRNGKFRLIRLNLSFSI